MSGGHEASCHRRWNSFIRASPAGDAAAPLRRGARIGGKGHKQAVIGVCAGMLEIRHLVKRFGPLTAVDDVSFTVPKGEVLGFLGPNGAGKSTTMKMITGFLAPTAGTAIICGYDIAAQPIAAKR